MAKRGSLEHRKACRARALGHWAKAPTWNKHATPTTRWSIIADSASGCKQRVNARRHHPSLSTVQRGIMKGRIDKKRPKTVAEVERFAKEEWTAIRRDKPLLKRLFGNMGTRLQAVIDGKGAVTRY